MSTSPSANLCRVCVAICTFRRNPQLAQLLDRLDDLTFTRAPRPTLSVLVVDNAPEGAAKEIVTARDRADSIHYVHLGAGNIAAARNEVFRQVPRGIDLIVCIDDDEFPEPQWIEELLLVQRDTDADMVVGPVRPRFPESTPEWILQGDFFDLGEAHDRSELHDGITGNALLRRSSIEALGLYFDERLGTSGGEDQLFFRSAIARGANVRYSAHAVVHEPVALARLSVRYLVRREFRKGNTLGLLDRGAPGWPPSHPLLRIIKAAAWFARGVVILGTGAARTNKTQVVQGLMQISRALGMVAGLVGYRFEEYRQTAPTAGHAA